MPRQSSYRSEVLTKPAPTILAAAKNLTLGKSKAAPVSAAGGMLGDSWQDTAWDFYDLICEFRYSADFVGNLLSRAKLYVTKDGAPTQDPRATKALGDLFGGAEGQAEMLKMLGIHYTVAGEAILVGQAGDDGDEWYVVASTEVKKTATGNYEVSGNKIQIKPGSVTIRMWHEHPRKPWKANSPARACLPVLNELDKLTQHVAAQIDSRLISAGILWVPSEMSMPSSPITRTGDDETTSTAPAPAASTAQALSDIISEVASIAIRDRSDAAALVPIIVQVAGEFLDKIDRTEFWSKLDEQAIELRNEAIRRLALGMDMPPEILTGTADVNHWGAWQVDESAIKAHSEPLLQAITYALTTGYLRLVLQADMPKEEADRFAIAADTSAMRVRPNRSKESIELYDRGELSAAAMLRENGFEPTDAMADADRVNWLTKKLAQGQTTPELVAEGLRLLGVDLPEQLQLPAADHQARPDRSTADHPVRDLPDTQDAIPAELAAASEMMVFRALERAGNRIKGKMPLPAKVGTSAKDLYLSVPRMSESELDDLLIDAWSCTEWRDLGVDPHALATCLDGYTRTLLATRKPHEPGLLRTHLGLVMTLEPMRS